VTSRHSSESILAVLTIAIAAINFVALVLLQRTFELPFGRFVFECVLTATLAFVGWFSLRRRPDSMAQPLAGAWFFASPAIFDLADRPGYSAAETVAAGMSAVWLATGLMWITMWLWATVLALRKARK
jgi:hypothetical protein